MERAAFRRYGGDCRKWMKIIREQEKPDLVIGMFHAGQDAQLMGGKYREKRFGGSGMQCAGIRYCPDGP